MKRFKKLLLGLVAFAAMAVLCAVCAGAEIYGKYEYMVLDDGTVSITGYYGSETELEIPATIDGKSVTGISDEAFSNCSELTSIVIPDSVSTVRSSAFYGTALLYNQTEAVKYAGNWVIGCDTNATTVVIKSGTKGIADYAFLGCSCLESITIPNSMINIGNGAFQECNNLMSISMPNGVKKIGSAAFEGCSALTSLIIPDSVISIGYRAFSDCDDLILGVYCTNINVPDYTDEFKYTIIHKCSEWTVTSQPTCTDDGEKTAICSICEKSISKAIKATGHNYVTSVVKPTYTAEGYTLHKCSRCGNNYKDTYTAKLVVPTVSGLKCSSKTNVAVTLQWTKNTVADGYILDRYDSENAKWVTVKKITSNATTSYTVTGLRASTTNKFRIKAYKSTASSSFTYLNVNTRPYTTTGLSVSSKTNVAITLKWNKNLSADGYVLDKYDGTKWVTVKKITSNATTSYTVTGLKASTTYKFRLKAYKMYGTAYESSAFSYINVNTRPYTTTGFKISSTTKTTIKMQWNKNISASGYCIEKWDGSKWVQIKRFTSNANVSYTVVSGLKANTSYKFRLRAYKTIGTVNEYSAYTQTLTAKTKA